MYKRQSGLSVTMLILIPAAVGMAVLSYPIMGVLFPQKATIMTATLLLSLIHIFIVCKKENQENLKEYMMINKL